VIATLLSLAYSLQKSWTISPVRLDVRSEDQNLQPVGAGFERAHDPRTHAHGIKRPELHEVVVELHAPVAIDDHVDLLGRAVAMRERLALSGLDDKEVDPRLLCAEVLLGEASFLVGREPVLGR